MSGNRLGTGEGDHSRLSLSLSLSNCKLLPFLRIPVVFPPTDELNAALNNYHRMQYARGKEECREMDSHVGSGKIIGLIGSVPL